MLDDNGGLLARRAWPTSSSPIRRRSADLNAIVHPAVGRGDQIAASTDSASTDNVVVLDIPLLTENPRGELQGKIVVDVPVEVQVERLVRYRGFTEADVHAPGLAANPAARID